MVVFCLYKDPMPNNLRYLRRKHGLTLQELAEKTGASTSLLHKIENDERSIDKWKHKIAAALECHPDDLDVYALGPAGITQAVPIAGYVGKASTVAFYETHSPAATLQEHRYSPPTEAKNRTALQVRADGAAGLLQEGFLLFYDERLPGVPGEFIGKICAVWLQNGTCLIKMLQKGMKPGRYHLIDLGIEPVMRDVIVEYSAMITMMVQR